MNTTNEIITLVGHSRSVRCLHVDGVNEVRLVSGSNDRSIKVSDIEYRTFRIKFCFC
jgi:WD40 repeat protein